MRCKRNIRVQSDFGDETPIMIGRVQCPWVHQQTSPLHFCIKHYSTPSRYIPLEHVRYTINHCHCLGENVNGFEWEFRTRSDFESGPPCSESTEQGSALFICVATNQILDSATVKVTSTGELFYAQAFEWVKLEGENVLNSGG